MFVFSTQSSLHLAKRLAKRKGFKLGKVERYYFSDGELYLRLRDNVRGKKVLVFGGTEAPTENLLELLFIVRALHEAGVKPQVFISYLGYARALKAEKRGEPHRLKVIADIFSCFNIQPIILDIHDQASLQLFAGVKNISAVPQLAAALKAYLGDRSNKSKRSAKFKRTVRTYKSNLIVVAPDRGARDRARQFAKFLGTSKVLVIRKKRFGAKVKFSKPKVNLEGKTAVLVDDILSTGSTLFGAAKILAQLGAKEIYGAIVHGVFAGTARLGLRTSPIKKLFVTNSLGRVRSAPKIQIVDIAPLIRPLAE